MKNWSQMLRAHYRAMLDELGKLAPQSPVLLKAKTTLEIAEEIGVKPSGRPPSEARQAKRQMLLERVAERDTADEEVARLYTSGLSLIEVGRRMGGHSTAWVTASLARTGTPTRPRGNSHNLPDYDRIERIRAMRAENPPKTLDEIGAIEHISRERVRQIATANGIDTSPATELTDEQKAAVAEYVAGASRKFVAVRYGVGVDTIRNWVSRAGHVPRREKRPNSEKTKRDAERAAQLYRQGKKAREIAKILGRGKPETIYRLLAIAGVTPDRQPKSGRHALRQ